MKTPARQWRLCTEVHTRAKEARQAQIESQAEVRRAAKGITVMTYNVLSQELLARHPHLYRSHVNNLAWPQRAAGIVADVALVSKLCVGSKTGSTAESGSDSNSSAVVVCMQEVEPAAFEFFAHAFGNSLGYKGEYAKRLNNTVDGCALFYDPLRLRKIHDEKFDFHSLTEKDNIALIAIFELINPAFDSSPFSSSPLAPPAQSPIRFCIATTHLLFNTNRGLIKLAQLHSLVSRVHQLCYLHDGIDAIICGDFNMTEQSVMYHYLASGETEPYFFDEIYISGQNKLPEDGNLPYSRGSPRNHNNRSRRQGSTSQQQLQSSSPFEILEARRHHRALEQSLFRQQQTQQQQRTNTNFELSIHQQTNPNTRPPPRRQQQSPQHPLHTLQTSTGAATSTLVSPVRKFNPKAGAINSRLRDFLNGSTGILSHEFEFNDPILGNAFSGAQSTPFFTTCHAASQEMVDFLVYGGLRLCGAGDGKQQQEISGSAGSGGEFSRDVGGTQDKTNTSSIEKMRNFKLVATEYLELPKKNSQWKFDARYQMPGPGVPSDHIPIVVKFEFHEHDCNTSLPRPRFY
ncbi:Protein angel 2 [Physocladia obscura]|uniref:Protein angel 2 n=1 Tax=Physocladia obscura TaxID=109957 RepID=A0AAD5XFK2_9FUNG|nr:Protein angel 2 [Physocladia obscura]